MDIHVLIAIATLVVAILLFIIKLIPLEATALPIPIVIAVTWIVRSVETALLGFAFLKRH